MQFATISVEYLRYALTENLDFPMGSLEVLLTCVDTIIKKSNISPLFYLRENLIWFYASIFNFFQVVLLKCDKPFQKFQFIS